MKKLVASVGMVALGASGLQTAFAQGLDSPDPVRPWSVSATLRGFYDDNRDTLHDDISRPGYERESFGFEIAPSAKIGWAFEQTALNLGYTYSYKWYDEDSYWDTDDYSQSHDINLAVDHTFSPRARLSVRDSFVIGQEPDQLRSANTLTTLQRVPGDNIRNEARIQFEADLTRQFGMEVGYANSFFDYEDDFNTPGSPSLSGLLDRMRHMVNLDGRLNLTPSTVGVLGYAFSVTDYLRDEIIAFEPDGSSITSDARNNRSHYVYVGVDHSFTSDLSGSVRVGGRYNDYYNDPNNEDGVSPYARASVRYAYMPASYVEAGVAYDRTATDLVAPGGGDFVRDQDAGTIFASVHHQILPKLMGSVLGQFQNNTFNGGALDDEDEQFYMVGLNLEYQFNRNFAAHVGYNFDFLDSDGPGREYDRNRVYLGVTATY